MGPRPGKWKWLCAAAACCRRRPLTHCLSHVRAWVHAWLHHEGSVTIAKQKVMNGVHEGCCYGGMQRAPVVIMVAGYCPLPDGTATFCSGDTARR